MKINKWTLGLAAVGLVSLGSVAQAEEKTVPLMTALSSTTLSGYVDTSAVWNPGSGNANPAPFAFNAGKQDGFNVNSVDLRLEKPLTEDQWAAGYVVELMFGPDASGVTGSIFGTSSSVRQAYVAVRAPIGNGLDFKVGRWDNIIGYESTDSFKNPNFTHSYAWTLEPTAHTGILATYQATPQIGLSVGVANTLTTGAINGRAVRGISVSESKKAIVSILTLTAPESWGSFSGSALYVGVDNGFGSFTEDRTHVYVGASVATPVKGFKVGASYDSISHMDAGGVDFGYVAAYNLYASFQATDKLTISGRAEYARGANLGTILGASPFRRVIALTGTVDYALWQNVVSRLEVRWDHAADGSNPFGGSAASGFAPTKKNDLMVAANLVYKF